jgi:hypothetical protein
MAAALDAYPIVALSGNAGGNDVDASYNGAAYVGVGSSLYRSLGTADGTYGAGANLTGFTEWDGKLYEGLFSFLLRMDPVSPETTEIKDADGSLTLSNASAFVPAGDKLYFAAQSQDTRRHGLFVLDRGSTAARYLGPGTPLGAVNGNLLYVVNDQIPGSYRWSLWRTDGTNTEKLKDDFQASNPLLLNDSTLLFNGPGGLWKTDGTAAGTVLVKADANGIFGWLKVGDAAYFINGITARPSGLWKTDGTPDGTVLLRESVFNGSQLSPRNGPSMTAVGDTLYFVGYPGSGSAQLFSTRGPGTTRQVTFPAGDSSYDGVVPVLASVGGKVFFSARVNSPNFELWQTDGTPGNMTRVPGYVISDGRSVEYGPLDLAASGGSLYFTQKLYNGPTRLWRYGVTPAALDPDGTLVVYGTDPAEGVSGNDTISLAASSSASGDAITATVNGETFSFPAISVRRIAVNALGGDDALTVSDAVTVPVTYNASGGSESFTIDGTAGDDRIVVGPESVRIGDREFHFSNLERLVVNALGGNDSITIDGTPAAEVTVDAGGGDEQVLVYPTGRQPLSGRLTVFGGDGVNSLVLDDSAREGPQTYRLTEFSLDREGDGGPGTLAPPVRFADFHAGVSLVAGRGADVVRVVPGGKVALSVDGGPPGSSGPNTGDAIGIVPEGATGARLEPSPPDGGRYVFANRQPVTFVNIEIPDNLRDPSATAGRLVPGPGATRVAVTFDEPVILPPTAGDALRLTNLSTGLAVDPAGVRGTFDPSTGEAAFTFANGTAAVSLRSGTYQATVPAGSVTDLACNPTASDFTFQFSVAPKVTGFWVDGSAWPQSFRDRIARGGGSFRPGWLLDPNPQFWLVPWAGINRAVVRFDGPVEVDAADLQVRGVNVPLYGISGFAYDPATYTATWTLDRAFDVDKVLFTLDGHSAASIRGTGPGVAPGTGPLLDGENHRAGAPGYPSGDGAAGGDFRGRLDVVVGDASTDGRVNASDLGLVRQHLNAVPPPSGQGGGLYATYLDIVPDGRINALDLGVIRQHLNRTLPAGDPGPLFPPPPAALAAPAAPRATESLFAQTPILA